MAQAIITKFLGPTNTKGSRIKAASYDCTVTCDYYGAAEGGCSNEQRYRAVAQVLVDKMNSERPRDGNQWVLQEFTGLGMPSEDGYAFGIELV